MAREGLTAVTARARGPRAQQGLQRAASTWAGLSKRALSCHPAAAQVQYQLSGVDLGDGARDDARTRQRVAAAYQRTVGPGVNATLLDLQPVQQAGARRRPACGGSRAGHPCCARRPGAGHGRA